MSRRLVFSGPSSVELDDRVPESHSQQLVSLILADTRFFKSAGLSVIFRPWREYLAFVTATPAFPFNLAARDSEGVPSLVLDAVLERPSVAFVPWQPGASHETYPHHPPESTRLQHNVYWALLTLMCTTHRAVLNAVSKTEPCNDTDRRLWRVLAAHAPLAQIFYDFARTHGRVATDVEYYALAARSVLPRTRFTHPTLHMPCLLTTADFQNRVSFRDTHHTELPPLERARRELRVIGWLPPPEVEPAIDAALAVEFSDTVEYARNRLTAVQRSEMHQNEFVHFRIDQLDPNFVFNQDTMLICFAATWRVNQLAALVLSLIDRYAVTVNIGAAEVTAAPAGLFESAPADDEGSSFPVPSEVKPDPDAPPEWPAAGASAKAPRKQCGAREQQRLQTFIGNVDSLLRFGGAFATEGSVRVHPASGQRIDRYRRVVPEPIRRVIYRLKEAMTTHNELFQWCLRRQVYEDSAICGAYQASDGQYWEPVYEHLYPLPHRAVGFRQQRNLAASLCDAPFLRNNVSPVTKQNPNQRLWQETAYTDALLHTFFEKNELKAGRDAWSMEYADVKDAKADIVELTYSKGQNRAFVDFMGSVLVLFFSGMYETSSVLVPYAEMLRVHAAYSPGAENYRRIAQTLNRDVHVARLAYKEHILCMLTGVPSLRHSLAAAYPEHYYNLLAQATLLTDEVRCVLNHPMRWHTASYTQFVVPLFDGLVVQRNHTSTKASDEAEEHTQVAAAAKNAGKRAKQIMREKHADMLKATQRSALGDVYALCSELIWFWRPRASDSAMPPPQEAFFRNVVSLYGEPVKKTAHTAEDHKKGGTDGRSVVGKKPPAKSKAGAAGPRAPPKSKKKANGTDGAHAPLTDHAYRLVDEETREAIVEYGRAHVERGKQVNLMDLGQFGVSRGTCELLSALREAYCVTGNHKMGLKAVLQLEPREQFTFYFFCTVVAQMMSYRTIRLNAPAFAAAQLQRLADALSVGAHQVTSSLAEVFFCTQKEALHSPLEICALGPRGVSTSFFSSAGPENETKGVMKRRRQHPPIGMLHPNAVGVLFEFPNLLRSYHTYRRRAPTTRKKSRGAANIQVDVASERPATGKRATSNRDGYGGRGSARYFAQSVSKQAYEAAIRVSSKNPDHYALMPLDVIRETYVVHSRQYNLMTNAPMVSRHKPVIRDAYPERRPQFTVPDVMPDSATTFNYVKKVRALYLTPCCGSFAIPSAAQFNGYDEQEHAWCGHCPSAVNVRRYIPTCGVCGCFTSMDTHDKRVYLYDDVHDHCFRHIVLCDECHFYTCAILNGYVLPITVVQRLRHDPEGARKDFLQRVPET